MYREEITLLHNYDNINILNFSLLSLFPLALLFILFYKCKILKKNEFNDECLGIEDSRALQVFAALGVLLHHLTGAATNYGKIYKGPVTFMSYMGILFTSIFFFFSGFGLIRSYILKDNYLDSFIKKKINSILIPFIFTNLIYVLIGLAEGRITDSLSFFTSIFGITLINTNAWFIVEIFILYLSFYFSFKYIKDDKIKISAVIIVDFVITLTGFLLKHDYSRINGHWFMGEWWFNTTMIFAVGLVFGKYRDQLVTKLRKKYPKALIASALFFIVISAIESYARKNFSYYVETYTYNGYMEKGITYVAQTIMCFTFIILMILITMKVKFGNKIIRFLMPYTLEIYLIQDICMINYGYDVKTPDWLFYIVAIVVTIGAAILLNKLLNLIRNNIDSFVEKKYINPDFSFEKREKYRKERTVTITFIAFYVLMTIGLIASLCQNMILIHNENKLVINQLNIIKDSDLYSQVQYGFYDSNATLDGNEELSWYIIKKEDDKVLLLLKDSLWPMAYQKEHTYVSYYDSDVRDILINEGCYELFNKAYRKYLVADEVTGDKVFLLSVDDVKNYSIPADILMSKPTEDAKKYTGIYIDNHNKNTAWWLRDDNAVINASIVNSNGIVSEHSQEVNRSRFALRPAIWVKVQY